MTDHAFQKFANEMRPHFNSIGICGDGRTLGRLVGVHGDLLDHYYRIRFMTGARGKDRKDETCWSAVGWFIPLRGVLEDGAYSFLEHVFGINGCAPAGEWSETISSRETTRKCTALERSIKTRPHKATPRRQAGKDDRLEMEGEVSTQTRLAELLAKYPELWVIEKEPHSYNDGTKEFTHVRYRHKPAWAKGEEICVEIGSHVTPDLAELLILLRESVTDAGQPTAIERYHMFRKNAEAFVANMKTMVAALERDGKTEEATNLRVWCLMPWEAAIRDDGSGDLWPLCEGCGEPIKDDGDRVHCGDVDLHRACAEE